MASTRRYLLVLQAFAWLLSITLFYYYLKLRLHTYPSTYVLGVVITSFVSFAAIIYGYLFLYNILIGKQKLAHFLGAVLLLFLSVCVFRVAFEDVVIAPLAGDGSSMFFADKVQWTYTLVSCFFALVVGILSKSFMEVIFLRTRQAEIEKKRLEAELMQLKAHVQPHFLFNSLNNIYYDTYKSLPQVAERISKLSNIMRYFIEENPKEKVPVSTEINFIESYIELEKVRFHSTITVDIRNNIEPHTVLPPMLLIPLVENAFKHGIQNNGGDSKIFIDLFKDNGKLMFVIKNTIQHPVGTKRIGTGLRNLRERLSLLYKENFSLHVRNKDGYFIAELVIPLYEN
jgi:LytS/YehU family sensor histidine kinase